MPGGIRLQRDSREGRRWLHTIRGTVTGHAVRVTGWWIFKERIAIMKIALDPSQVEAFNRLARQTMCVDDSGNLAGIAQALSIGVAEAKLAEFPVGANVAVVFGYAGPIEQFFNGRDPLAVVDIKIITADTVLPNEVKVSLVDV